MATTTAATVLLLCAFVVLAPASTTTAAAADDGGFTTFKLYFHDIVGGTSPTAIRIAQAPSSNSSSTFFGAVVAIDDPLTTAPARSSGDEVGRAQGTYTFADRKTFGLLMAMNFVFTAGEHNGSSLAILGRNQVLDDVREMSIVGGSGKFRMARGYVQAHTVDSGATSGETVVQYTVNVKA
ncbi:hypothetical protein BS78_05G086600 [Paspalum vaginatum]|nr:hypothetical protein BS78_05G086600 [Paspalum vaginatum]